MKTTFSLLLLFIAATMNITAGQSTTSNPNQASTGVIMSPPKSSIPNMPGSHTLSPYQTLALNSSKAESPFTQAVKLTQTFVDLTFDNTFIPADPIGTASRTTLVSAVNSRISIRTKLGVSLLSQSLNAFFHPLSPVSSLFDPKIVYDEYEDRFVMVVLEQVSTSPYASRLLLAVSTSGSPTGSASWYQQAIDAKEFIAAGAEYAWADYPGFELSYEAVYITANLFGFSTSRYYGSRLWIIAKTSFYGGGAISYTKHNPFAGQPDSSSAPALIHGGPIGNNIGTYLVTTGLAYSDGTSAIEVTTVLDPLGTPTFQHVYINLGVIAIPFTVPDAPQLGSSNLIAAGDTRALDAVWRDNGLWVTTTVEPSSGPNANQSTAYWIKLNTQTMTLEQQGEIGGEDIAPGTYTSYASVAVNSNGVAAFGFSASGPLIYAGAYVAMRFPSDVPGTIGASIEVQKGVDSYYRTYGGTENRWGDYSGIALDPVDDSFWIYNMYANAKGFFSGSESGVWTTVWGRLTTSTPTVSPTNAPTSPPTSQPNPTSQPTPSPTSPPTGVPTSSPTSGPTSSSTSQPTKSPTNNPTSNPTSQPTPSPTNQATSVPTLSPTNGPTPPPSSQPTKLPTNNPTSNPTSQPTPSPTNQATSVPTSSPTNGPTPPPSSQPTKAPTNNPTSNPTSQPTPSPTNQATSVPTSSPTNGPTLSPTSQPTKSPTNNPTSNPTSQPTPSPTNPPTGVPTSSPTSAPTSSPTSQPTKSPTNNPTSNPTSQPTPSPTNPATGVPTSSPTKGPTSPPSSQPTKSPTNNPTSNPTSQPTPSPTNPATGVPTSSPTKGPTSLPSPTSIPTKGPTSLPTNSPTNGPTTLPGGQPTSQPTIKPTSYATRKPSIPVTKRPTGQPTGKPTSFATKKPSIPVTKRPTGKPTAKPT